MIDFILTLNPATVAMIAVLLFAAALLFDTLVLQHGMPETSARVFRAVLKILVVAVAAVLTVMFLRSALAAWIAGIIALIFQHGIVMGIVCLCIVYSAGISLWRILGARTMRTFMQRLVMGVQRVITFTVIGVILVAISRGGFGFFGAPLFAAVAVLIYWSLRTGEAKIDRRDRLVTVVRRYA